MLGVEAAGICSVAVASEGVIEIISAGKKYGSIGDYKKAEENSIMLSQSGEDELKLNKKGFLLPLVKRIDMKGHLPIESLFNVEFQVNTENFQKMVANTNIQGESVNIDPMNDVTLAIYKQFLPSFIAMRKIGFETGITKVIEDFQINNKGVVSYKRLKSSDLESVLSQSFSEGSYQGPILLISDKKKVRIMTLDLKSGE
jgi:hypothetical protein